MVDSRGLTYKEEKWLDVLSKDNEFFSSLNSFYDENGYLTDNQYYYLKKEILKDLLVIKSHL